MRDVKALSQWARVLLMVLCTSACVSTRDSSAWRDIPLPIAYEYAAAPNMMYFMNEAEGIIQRGNRNPGDWLLFGQPSNEFLEPCKAGTYRCVRGWASLAPIVVGDMPEGVRQTFPGLGVAVTRHRTLPCDTFETRPLDQGQAAWTQDVTYCGSMGVVQVVRRDGGEVHTFNLKSAVGLFGTVLLRVRDADS